MVDYSAMLSIVHSMVKYKKDYIGKELIVNPGSTKEERTEITDLFLDNDGLSLVVTTNSFSLRKDIPFLDLVRKEPQYVEIRDVFSRSVYRFTEDN